MTRTTFELSKQQTNLVEKGEEKKKNVKKKEKEKEKEKNRFGSFCSESIPRFEEENMELKKLCAFDVTYKK